MIGRCSLQCYLACVFWEPPQVVDYPFWYWGSKYSFLRQESDWPSLARYLSTATVFRQGPHCLVSLKLKGHRFLKIGPPTQKERIRFQHVFSRKVNWKRQIANISTDMLFLGLRVVYPNKFWVFTVLHVYLPSWELTYPLVSRWFSFFPKVGYVSLYTHKIHVTYGLFTYI